MIRIASLVAAIWFAGVCTNIANTFHVGPQQKLQNISDVPWESLTPGDEVAIHWRAEPYKEKWVICAKGTATAPIVVRGIPSINGNLPVIEGSGARTRKQLSYWGDVRATLKIGGAQVPKGLGSEYIVLENLEIRGARPPYTFTDSHGKTKTYDTKAAALWVEKGYHLTIRNCILTDSAIGLFISSNDQSASTDILVEKCHIHANGLERTGRHNIYTAANGLTFQFNRLGPLRPGCVGNNLKDRSAGLVVRYNWIEGGDKQLDLVDAEDSALLRNNPAYRKTFVYGNIFIKPSTAAHNQLVHYGGDSDRPENYRKGTLYFYNNTVVSYRKDPINLFWLSSNDEHCDFRNNIICSTTNGKVYPLSDKGSIDISHNLLPENWANGIIVRGTINDDRTSVKRSDPGFLSTTMQDFHLKQNSSARDAGKSLPQECSPNYLPINEYGKHTESRIRPKDSHLDLGAYEFGTHP